jgi:hypothetical protein
MAKTASRKKVKINGINRTNRPICRLHFRLVAKHEAGNQKRFHVPKNWRMFPLLSRIAIHCSAGRNRGG